MIHLLNAASNTDLFRIKSSIGVHDRRVTSKLLILAPSENRSTKSADGMVATEAAWLNEKTKKSGEDHSEPLTRIGLLMEGLCGYT